MADPNAREMEEAAARAEASGPLARIGHVLFRWRSFTPVPLIVVAVPIIWGSRGEDGSRLWLWSGLLACFAGQVLRAWVIGLVPDGTSGQNEKLIATGLNSRGPYARTRNPLYLGNFGISIGLALVTHSPALVLLTALLFFLQYAAIISVEEAFLRERFGTQFLEYCARVPRFFPRPWRKVPSDENAARPPWSMPRAIRKEHNPLCAWVLLVIFFLALDRALPGIRVGLPKTIGGLGLTSHVVFAAVVLALWLIAKGWKHHWLSGNFVADLQRRIRETKR